MLSDHYRQFRWCSSAEVFPLRHNAATEYLMHTTKSESSARGLRRGNWNVGLEVTDNIFQRRCLARHLPVLCFSASRVSTIGCR